MAFWLMLEGGPCAGGYHTARAPAPLRATLGPAPKRKCDVLDLPEDEPQLDEEIHLYERTSSHVEGVMCIRPGGCGHIVRYRYVRLLRGQASLFDPDPQEVLP